MNRVDLGARLLDGHAGLQFADCLVKAHARRRRDDLRRWIHSQHAIRGRFGGVEVDDYAKRLQLRVKACGEDRRNRRRPSIDADRAADHVRIILKQPREHAVRNRDRLWIGVSGQRAQHRLRAGNLPESLRGRNDAQSRRFTPDHHRRINGVVGNHVLERCRLRLPDSEVD
jgi:hypothetical protein